MALSTQISDDIQLGLGLVGLPTNLTQYITDCFIATAGQTVFILSNSPLTTTLLHVIVDGNMLLQAQYGLSGSTMTLTSGLTVGDFVTFGYYINA